MLCYVLFFIHLMLSNIPSAPAYGVYAFMHPSSFTVPIVAQIMVTFYQASGYRIYYLSNTFEKLCGRSYWFLHILFEKTGSSNSLALVVYNNVAEALGSQLSCDLQEVC